MRDLSVLIPSRNEMFLLQTIEDVLKNMRGNSEIVVVLDGEWPIDPIPDDPRVHLIYHPESIGQRAATNEAARVARGKYLMKLDAHCAVDEGFDLKLIEPYESGEISMRTTSIPRMYNLHVFDWQCPDCGQRGYQGPEPTLCGKLDPQTKVLVPGSGCGSVKPHTRVLVWTPRWNRLTDFARFDTTPQFQYWQAYKRRIEAQPDLADVMCHVGAGWMLPRDQYFAQDGMDEGHGSWGQMGIEVSCKAWLGGGRQIVNKRTWYSHLFRTQPGFSFPYRMKEHAAENARAYSRKLWFENTWRGQVKPLSWLVEKFAPVPVWHEDHGSATRELITSKAPRVPSRSVGAVYITDNQVDPGIFEACRRQLVKALDGIPLVTVSLEPLYGYGTNIHYPGTRGRLQMFRQWLMALEASDADDVFLCEHDVLYHPTHFQFRPPTRNQFHYNQSVWRVNAETGQAVTYRMMSVSGCCASRNLLVDHYRAVVQGVEASGYDHARGYEPGVRDGHAVGWRSRFPNVDIRHGKNLTASRWHPSQFRDKTTCEDWTTSDEVPGWGSPRGRFQAWLKDLT